MIFCRWIRAGQFPQPEGWRRDKSIAVTLVSTRNWRVSCNSPGGLGAIRAPLQEKILLGVQAKMLRFIGIQNALDEEWDPSTVPWPVKHSLGSTGVSRSTCQ